LYELACSENPISTINIKKNHKLGHLGCYGTNITKIDISNCPLLVTVMKCGYDDCDEDAHIFSRLIEQPFLYIDVNDDVKIVTNKSTLKGWVNAGFKYYYSSKNKPVSGWKKINKKWYYFGNYGWMVTGPMRIGKKNYFFKNNGVMATKSWQKDEEDNWYYANKSGVLATGWKKIKKKWYWFYSDGMMACNTKIKIKGKWYKFNKNGVCTNP
jgi:glucan-binding YG repeat protein